MTMKNYAIQLIPDSVPKVLKPMIDTVRDSSGKIIQGLVIGSTQPQNEALILASNPGEFKNSPRLGVGLENALLSNTDDLLQFRHATRASYALDGLKIEQLDMYDAQRIKIKASYE